MLLPLKSFLAVKHFLFQTGPKSNLGFVESLALIIHGTKDKPLHYQKRRTYDRFIWRVKKCKYNLVLTIEN